MSALAFAAACLLSAWSAPATENDVPDPIRGAQRLKSLNGSLKALSDTGSGITRDVGSIAVIEHDGSNYDRDTPDGVPNYAARVPVARRFYQTHGDFYDFVVVFTNFEFQTGGATGDAQAFYNLVRNDVRGIGRVVADNGALFGSPGRLKGYIDMADMGRWRRPGSTYSLRPGDPGFLVTLNVLAHEVAHQWLAEARYQDAAGKVSSDLLGKDGAHWSYLLDSDASVMYGSDWMERGAGHWLAARTLSTYSALDLYLMGFLDPAKVPAFSLLRNPAVDAMQFPVQDAEVDAAVETVTLPQVVAAMGPRSPDHRSSPKEFRLGFIFLTRPGTEPDPEDLAAVETVRQFFAAHFFALTRGAALADTTLAETVPGDRAATPDLDRALSWLLAQQSSDGRWEDSSSTAVRDTSSALEALALIGRTDLPYQQGLAWLGGTPARHLDSVARRAATLAATTGTSNARAPLIQGVLTGQATDGGFGFLSGFRSDALDTALALRALAALKQPPGTSVRRALASLGELQLSTGGWPAVEGGEMSNAVTAHVLLALQDWGGAPEAQVLMAPGLTALLARRNSDGGFGESPSTPYGTALALQVLLRSDAPPEIVDGAVAWLQGAQLTDGSWGSSRYETALVLAALRGGATPNLTVPADSLTLEPPTVKEGQTVHISAWVRNTGRKPAPATRARLYDGAPGAGNAVADATVPPLDADAQATISFDFPTTDRAGDRTIYVVADADGAVVEAREDDNAASRALKVEGLLADLVVRAGDLSVSPYPPEEGETVQVSIRVTNAGQKVSAPSLVRLTRGNPRSGGALLGQTALPSLGVGASAVVALPWNTTGQIGDHVLYGLADAAFTVFESDETNNETALPVRVSGPLPLGADLEVALVTLDPPALRTTPTTVEARAVVRNLGRDAAVSTVAFYDGSAAGIPLAERPVDLGPRSSTVLAFTVDVTTPGQRSFVVRADPSGTLTETNEANNEVTAVLIDPQNTVDLEISDQDLSPSSPEVVVGQRLVVTAVVHNRGTAPVTDVPVILSHASSGELARTTVTLSPGASGSVTLIWTTSFTGDPVPLVVQVDPFGLLAEIFEDNNAATLNVRVAPSALTNLRTSGGDIHFAPDPPREGQEAAVSAIVRNPSPVPAGPFKVRFYRGDPNAGGTLIGESPLAGLDPASAVTASVTWAPVDVRGAQGVFAIVDPVGEVPEYDETDNRAFRPFSILALPDLALTPGQVALDPRYPRSSETVTVRGTVRNFGQQESAPAALRAFEGEPGSGSDAGSATIPPIAPGGFATVELAWTPSAPRGERTLSLVADADSEVRELDEGNNVARLNVLVQDADLFLTEAYFSPDGDGVRDSTTLGYRATGPVTVVVSNSLGRRVRTLAENAPAVGSFTWDGRDDAGRLLFDGTYTFTLEGEAGAVLGRIPVFFDTNRESVHHMAGTGLLAIRNLTCELPDDLAGPAWMPGEDEALFIVNETTQPPFPLGLVRVSPESDYAFVAKDPWYQFTEFASERAVSPDGREVLILKNDDLYAVDLSTGTRRLVAPDFGTRNARWSPDGRWIATSNQVLSSTDGAVVTELPRFVYFGGWAWSPDSEWLAAGDLLVRRDGSQVKTIPGIHAENDNIEPFGSTWRGDGKVVSRIGFGCGDGCASSGVFVIDPETETATELGWLRQGYDPDRFRGPLGWSADGSKLLYLESRRGFPPVANVSGDDGSSPVQLLPHGVELSPRSAAVSFTDRTVAHTCLGQWDIFAGISLQNLTVGLRAVRLPSNNGILVSGTVSDRHLSYHQLEYAPQAEPESWRPIGPASEIPVLDEVLTPWVPPAPGTYLLRLRAEDRAGNVRSRTKVIAWDRVPVLANVTQTETLISPNGDGTKDSVTFNYLVVEPTRVEVRIVGPETPGAPGPAPTVRLFALDHPEIGPGSFPWDGRDEQGAVVPDGRYTVFINDLPLRVNVDATPPDISWSYDKLRAEDRELRADRRWHVADFRLKSWRVPDWFAGSHPVYEPVRDANGDVVYEDGVPRMLLVGGRPVDLRERVPTRASYALRSPEPEVRELATDPGAVFTADDYAGNRSTVSVLPVEERLFLLTPPLNDETVGTLAPRTTFLLAETIRGTPEEGEEVRFQFHPKEGGAWRDGPPFMIKDGQDDWDADFAGMGLTLGREYRGRFVARARGRDFPTHEFLFRPCTAYLELGFERLFSSPSQAKWRFSLASQVPEKLVSATLTITGEGKLGGYRTVTPFDFPYTVVWTPFPSCDTDPPSRLVFELKVTGESGRVYTNDNECRILRKFTDLCSSLNIVQEYAYCKGSPDEILLKAAATSTVTNARARVERGPESPGKPITEFAVPFKLEEPLETAFAADVTGLPEGTVPVRGVLGNAENPTMARGGTDAIIDRTAPLVEVVEPPEGGQLCVTTDPATGLDKTRLFVEVDDAGTEAQFYEPSADVERLDGPLAGTMRALRTICPAPDPEEPAGFPPLCGNSVKPSFTDTGRLLTGVRANLGWDVTDLPEGDYAVRLAFCDRAGNRTTARRRVSLVRKPPYLTLVDLSHKYFSPNSDGAADDTTVRIRTGGAVKLTVTLQARGLTRTLARDLTLPAGEHAFVWDGKADDGSLFPDGTHRMFFKAADPCGRPGELAVELTVDTVPPVAVIAVPTPGQAVGVSAEVRGTADDLNLDGYALSYGAGPDPAAWIPIGPPKFTRAVPAHDPPSLLARWDLPATPGPYTLRLVARDLALNQSAESRVTVEVRPRIHLGRLTAAPDIFSPNGDGRRETSTIEYELVGSGRVTLEVRGGAAGTRTLEAGIEHPPGLHAFVWDGLLDGGTPAIEGEYLVRIRVEDPAGVSPPQEEMIPLTLDRTPPVIAVETPMAEALMRRDANVLGFVSDPLLSQYVVTDFPAAGGDPIELSRGAKSPQNHNLGSLAALGDGRHTLFVRAEDAAENRAAVDVPFAIDSVPPVVALHRPPPGAVLDKGAAPIEVVGTATDEHLDHYTLSFGPGTEPAYFSEIARTETGGLGIRLGSWSVDSVPDGPYMLRLEGLDRAGLSAEARETVILDGTPPRSEITDPAKGSYVNGSRPITGTATDANLESWKLESAPGPAADAYQWSPVAEKDSGVSDGILSAWEPLPPDGVHTLRLTTRDRAGHVSTAHRTVTVDTTPPAAPTGLATRIDGVNGTKARVRVTWNENTEPDLAGYHLSRDGIQSTTDLLTTAAYFDLDRPDGRYRYSVVAVDRAGNVSPPAAVTARVDLTPPLVDILHPQEGSAVSGSVEVRGTAFSADDFQEYRLYAGASAEPTVWTLLKRSTIPVAAGELGTWTAVGDGPFVLALEAEDVSGNRARVTLSVVVDNQPPAAPALTSVTNTPESAALTSAWESSVSADIAGYLVYRSGHLANAPGLVVGDLRGFLVPGLAYVDSELPDGNHCYRVVAMEHAGNLSPPSNEICRSLDNRAPAAAILQPPSGTRFDYPLRVVAFSPDTDVASVQFQIKAESNADWQDLGVADTREPFEMTLDPAPLAFGAYDLRAVATDTGGRTDPSPAFIFVTYGDATPPRTPEGLVARVDGAEVALTWEPVDEALLAGYHVFRDGERLTTDPVTPSFTDPERPPGLYQYAVTAIDLEGNESPPSRPAAALVYVITLDPPPFPVTSEVAATLSGTGAQPGTTLQILRGDAIVREEPSAAAGFRLESIPLVAGPNLLRARGVDDQGNRSLPSEEVVLISNAAPPAVTNLAAGVSAHDVDLVWDPVSDPELHGYVIERGDEVLTGSSLQTDTRSIEASATWYDPWIGAERPASHAFDGDATTGWIAPPEAVSPTWTVSFAGPVLVDRVMLRFAAADQGQISETAIGSYRIEASWEGRFVPLAIVGENTSATVEHVLPTPFATDALRVVLPFSPAPRGLAEVAVSRIEVVPAGTNVFRDAGAADGVFHYRVSAVDRYGALGPAGVTQATVGDVVPPAAPTGLVAVVVGSDVSLTWNASLEPDVVAYIVLRDGARIGTTQPPAHVDGGLRNGVYRYTVIAVDAAGNESPESGPATATVAVGPPAAPVLRGSAEPAGDVRLEWDHPGAPDFAVYRSLVAGGPYAPLARTGGALVHRDPTAAHGVAHFYVVRALDLRGNASDPSNEVTVTPLRTTPLAAPEIFFPTDAAHPVTLESTRTEVQGHAEPETLVSLDVDGVLAGLTPTEAVFVERGAVALAPGTGDVVISRDAQRLAYTLYRDGNELHVLDVATGMDQRVDSLGYRDLQSPALTLDGRRLAYVAVDYSTYPFRIDLFTKDLADGSVIVVEDLAGHASQPTWSPDGTRLAFVVTATSWPYQTTLQMRDVVSGVTTVLATEGGISSLAWSPDGTRLAFVRDGAEVSFVEVASGLETVAAPGADPNWSPDGTHLAYSVFAGSQWKIVVRSLATGFVQDITDGSLDSHHPAYDATGTRLSFVERHLLPDDEVREVVLVQDLAGGRRRRLEPRPGLARDPRPDLHLWLDDGRLALTFADARVAFFEAENGFFKLSEVALAPGENVLIARANDVASGVTSPDSAPVRVTATEAIFADLLVSPARLSVYPAVPAERQPTVLSAVVENVGHVAATDVRVRLTLVDPSGAGALPQEAHLSEIPPGAAALVSASWTPAVSGTHRLRVQADSNGAIDEIREDNNEAIRDIEVVSQAALVAGVRSDKTSYAARAPALIDVVLTNGGPPFDGVARARVEDASGREVAVLDVRPVSLPYGGEQRYQLRWNTGVTYAGDYFFRVHVTDGAETAELRAEQAFRILPDVSVVLRLVADRSVVSEGRPATFAGRVDNAGANAPLSGLVARFRIVPQGVADPVVFESTAALNLLLPGALWEGSLAWPSAVPAGAYRATLTVLREGQVLATAEAPFQVSPGTALFAGTLALLPADILQGGGADARLTVTNRAASAAAGVPVSVEVREGASAVVIQREVLTLDLLPGETRSATVRLGAPAFGTYPVLLHAGDPPTTLDRATLHVHGPITPPSVNAPADGARVPTAHPDLSVNNAVSPEGATLTYEFQLFADAALTVTLPATAGVPQGSGITAWRVPTKLAEDASYFWRARATDGFSSSAWTAVSSFTVDERNEPPSAPIPDQPEPGSRVASREPVLSVANAFDPELDPLTYEFRVAADPQMSSIVASVSGAPQAPGFTTWRVPVTLEEDATYYWNARASDGSGLSPWSAIVSFVVDTLDESPTAPTPLRPVGGVHVPLRSPELVVRNAVDPEGRALRYRFEVDRAPSFDSPDLQASPEVAEGSAETAWIPSAPLTDNTTHYWRAAASDGVTLGPWAAERFFVNLGNDAPGAPVPLEPADLQVVTTPTPTLRVRNAVDPDGDAIRYEFLVSDEADSPVASVSSVPEGATETAWTVPLPLAENGLFTWVARAHDAEVAGPWSAASRFRVNAVQQPPTAPGLVAPPEGAVLDTARPALVVSNATSPEGLPLTYAFELYAVDGSGTLTLIESASGVVETSGTTSWTPAGELPDGAYSWRARADDPVLHGPWMTSAHFRVVLDVPPAPPTGLAAVPGDAEVALTWNASPEPDVRGYRVYRGTSAGGPHGFVASTVAPSFRDIGLADGVTVYYVVTAVDTRFESDPSAEAAATPPSRQLVAEVRISPAHIDADCLFRCRGDDDDDVRTAHPDRDDDDDDDHEACPSQLDVAVELPAGHDPTSIDRASLRLAGSVAPYPSYYRFVDTDGDGLVELRVRFAFERVAPLLQAGTNSLTLTGRVAGAQFRGVATLEVAPLRVALRVTPRTLNRKSGGEDVLARLEFRQCVAVGAVTIASLRLNEAVPVKRLVTAHGHDLTVKFDRAAVIQLLPAGESIEVRVMGSVNGLPFVARDTIRVIK